MGEKRFQLVNMPRTYTDLSETQSVQLLTDDLKHIVNALNTLIQKDEDFYNSEITNLGDRVGALESTTSTTVSSTLPLGNYNNFLDRRYWSIYPGYWLSVTPTSTNVTIASQNAASEVGASYGIMAGMQFRPKIIPDANEEIEIRVKMVPVSIITTASGTGLECIFGLTRFGYSGAIANDIVHWGLSGIYHNVNDWFSSCYVFATPNSAPNTYQHNIGGTVITSFELKLIMSRGDPNTPAGYHVYTYEKDVNGAGFVSMTYGGLAAQHDKRTYFYPTFRFGLMAYSPRILNGMSVRFESFEIVKGIILNDNDVVP